MNAYFARRNIIVVMGKHMPYVHSVAKTIHHVFRPDAILFRGNFHPSLDVLQRLGQPIILCRNKYPLDADFLRDVRERDGLIVWTYKSRFLKADDLFVLNS